MIWINLAIGVVCGLAAALCAAVWVGTLRGNSGRFGIVFVVVLLILLGAARFLVQPHAEARYVMWRLDKQLADNAAFAAIKQYDTPTYRSLMSELHIAVRQGKGEAEGFALVRSIIEPLVLKRLPEASDEAAAKYMGVMIQEMTELQAKGDDLCFRYLFPQGGQGMDIQKHLSAETRKADNTALGELIRSASVSPQQAPLASEAEPLLQPVVAGMNERYGRDLGMLSAPQAPGVNRPKVCEMTISMYNQILKMPPAQSGMLIRYMLAKK